MWVTTPPACGCLFHYLVAKELPQCWLMTILTKEEPTVFKPGVPGQPVKSWIIGRGELDRKHVRNANPNVWHVGMPLMHSELRVAPEVQQC